MADLIVPLKKRPETPVTRNSYGNILNRERVFNLKDPALPTRWFVNVPDGGDIYTIVAEKITATFPKIPAKSRFTSGRMQYYPDNNEIDGLTITFYETYDYDVTRWLSRWRGRVVHKDGSYGIPVDYKKEITAQLYLPGSDTPSVTCVYKGAWPTDQSAFNLSYEDEANRIMVEAQFSVDELEMK